MEERLSSTTIRGSAITLMLGTLAAILWMGWAVTEFHHWHFCNWLASGIWLVIIALSVYQTLHYREVVLTQTMLKCTCLFARPAYYSLADLAGLHQTKLPYSPLRICFKDGKSFLFSPKLKDSPFSLRYLPAADFIEYWTEEIGDRAAALTTLKSSHRDTLPFLSGK